MAAWTQDDADAVRAAIRDLAIGKRVVTITFAGPPQQSNTYQAVDLKDLEALLTKIERSLSTKPGYRLASICKGV